MRIQALLCVFAVAFAALAAKPGFEHRSIDQVKVETGWLKGVISHGVVSFKGIPFAAPPIGDNRWRPPQPAKPWTGVRSAAEYAADPMQLPFPSDAAPLGTKPSEDCLYLNVWAPAEAATRKRPVMVWIYGGGFVNGGSSPAVYDGSHFAERGVVFVSFNYRLGRFGFFAHPALTRENPDGPLGNYAFMDQIAALQWVQRNISKFGGDPKNVTLFGESAGGISVLTLLTSTASRGLFQKAIVESGGGRVLLPMRSLGQSTARTPSAEAVGVAFAKSVGITGEDAAGLAALRKVPAEQLVAGLNLARMSSPTYAGPMIDGKIVVESPEQAFLGGREMKVPLIAGANSADIGFSSAKTMDEVFAPFGPDAAKARSVYDPENSGNVRAVGTAVSADQLMIEPARFVVETISAAGKPAFNFRFSYVAQSLRAQLKGAPHATEIPFVFDTVAAKYGDKLAPEDEAIAKAANEYWVAFAKYGAPKAAGLPEWPAYDAEHKAIMNFTESGPVGGADPARARLDLVETAAQNHHE